MAASEWQLALMWPIAFVLPTTLSAVPSPSRQEALMNSVERRIVMPAGADSLDSYVRFFAFGEAGELLGAFIHDQADGVSSGGRHWVASRRDLPIVMDSGCYYVTVVFDRREMKRPEASCNGAPPGP